MTSVPADKRRDHPEVGQQDLDPALNALFDHPAELLRILFDRMPMGIAIFDRDLVLRRCNPTWADFVARYTETPRHEVVPGRQFFDLAPGTEEATMPIFERVLAGETVRLDALFLQSGGGPLSYWDAVFTPLVEKGEVVGFIDVVTDATERTLAEKELRESEELLSRIMETNADGVVLVDRSGKMIFANAAAEKILGLTRDGLTERNYNDPQWKHTTVDGSPLPHEELPFVRVIRTGKPVYGVEFAIEPPGGTRRVVSVNGAPLRDAEGCITGMVASFSDVTERVRAYELLERRVEERTRELSALLEVSNNVASTLELEPLLDVILDQLETVVDYTDASTLMLDGAELLTMAYRGPDLPGDVQGMRFPLDREPWRTLWKELQSLEPVIIDDLQGDSPYAQAYQSAVGVERLRTEFARRRSWLGVPLVFKETVIGVLTTVHDEPGYYTLRHADLVRTIANQAAIAIENARLYERAQSVAALEERQRLARELHDSVSQALYGIVLGTDAAQTLLNRDPTRLAAPLEYVRSLAEAGLAEMRALIFELRPESLENEGLIAALEKHASSLRARQDILVQTVIGCDEPDLPLVEKEALYRIAQEALHNTVKHAQASSVKLNLTCDADGVTLTIRDDGMGFDPAGSFPGHLGLKSMSERATRLGGTLEVKSEPGKGTYLRAHVPS